MPAGRATDREIDHLGGEDEGPHHAQKRNFFLFEIPLRPAHHIPRGRYCRDVEGGPHRRGKKPVGDMHVNAFK